MQFANSTHPRFKELLTTQRTSVRAFFRLGALLTTLLQRFLHRCIVPTKLAIWNAQTLLRCTTTVERQICGLGMILHSPSLTRKSHLSLNTLKVFAPKSQMKPTSASKQNASSPKFALQLNSHRSEFDLLMHANLNEDVIILRNYRFNKN